QRLADDTRRRGKVDVGADAIRHASLGESGGDALREPAFDASGWHGHDFGFEETADRFRELVAEERHQSVGMGSYVDTDRHDVNLSGSYDGFVVAGPGHQSRSERRLPL